MKSQVPLEWNQSLVRILEKPDQNKFMNQFQAYPEALHFNVHFFAWDIAGNFLYS